MSALMPRFEVFHESAHCAALTLLGLPPKRVRVDDPYDGCGGCCTLDWPGGAASDLGQLRNVLVAIVVGGLTSGGEGWTFPIDPDRVAWPPAATPARPRISARR